MQPVLTPKEMAEADRLAIASGTDQTSLIDRAGRALAIATRQLLGGVYGRRAVVFCGNGKNGADGRVAAAVLSAWGVRVAVVEVAIGLDESAVARQVARADVLVDAMFGTGLRSALAGVAKWCAELVNACAIPVIAADIPSGVDGATGKVDGVAVSANVTCCFQSWKRGLLFEPGRSLAGKVSVVDLGIPVTSDTLVATEDDIQLPPRGADDHKWSRSVFVVGGSAGMTGAPILSARAAARCGAGVVVAALPGKDDSDESVLEVITRGYACMPDGSYCDDFASRIVADASRFSAVVVGPGIGRSVGARAVVARLIAEAPQPIVIDADGLNALAEDATALRDRQGAGLPTAVLTPHAGEFELLAGRPVGDDRIAAARDLSAALGVVVLLKGPGTVVAQPDGSVIIVATGSAKLATAGTGDVLAGVIGALLSAGMGPFEAAWSAAIVHAKAAVLSPFGFGTIASDLFEGLALACSQFSDSSNQLETE